MDKALALKVLFQLCIFILCHQMLFSQTKDSVLSYETFLENILMHHPIAKKANLKLKVAKAEILAARGNFDPEIFSDLSQKSFDEKLYYRQYQASLRIPTRFGVDVVAGYENTEGIFLNPESTTNNFGLWNLGLEVNLIQGLLINERKIALDQAKVFQNQAKNEQEIILNNLVYQATTSYLAWQQYAYFQEVFIENESIAYNYFENTKQSYEGGDKTALDTLEAYIAYQDVTALKRKNELGLVKSRLRVNNYLWFDDVPIGLQVNTKPENYKNQFFKVYENFELNSSINHPIILASLNKLNILELEQKLKKEKLKPKLKVKYNPLLSTSPNSISPNFATNNYTWGFDFSMPLYLRSERANVQQGELKIKESYLDLENKRNELENKIQSSWEQQLILQDQITLLNRNVERYRQLLDGENEKFIYGESSVFLLNKRREKYINGQLKLIEAFVSRQSELLNYLYFSNQLVEERTE